MLAFWAVIFTDSASFCNSTIYLNTDRSSSCKVWSSHKSSSTDRGPLTVRPLCRSVLSLGISLKVLIKPWFHCSLILGQVQLRQLELSHLFSLFTFLLPFITFSLPLSFFMLRSLALSSFSKACWWTMNVPTSFLVRPSD